MTLAYIRFVRLQSIDDLPTFWARERLPKLVFVRTSEMSIHIQANLAIDLATLKRTARIRQVDLNVAKLLVQVFVAWRILTFLAGSRPVMLGVVVVYIVSKHAACDIPATETTDGFSD